MKDNKGQSTKLDNMAERRKALNDEEEIIAALTKGKEEPKEKEEKEYRFSYILECGRVYTIIKATHAEAAHQKGKEQALEQFPGAHGFLTEVFGE